MELNHTIKGFYQQLKIAITFIITFIAHSPTYAAAPFLTDDPVALDYHHYEIFLFANVDKNNLEILEPDLQAPAIEVNWGAITNLQLHLVIPYAWSLPPAAPAANGIGDIEVGVTYRFIEETANRPQVALVPVVGLPTGNANRELGNGKVWSKIPISAQKSWGPWTTYSEIGYAHNTAQDMLNYGYGGWVVQRDLNEKLTLGAELFFQGKQTTENRSYTILNAGGSYNFTQNFSLVFSGGNSIWGENHLVGYLGLYWAGGGL